MPDLTTTPSHDTPAEGVASVVANRLNDAALDRAAEVHAFELGRGASPRHAMRRAVAAGLALIEQAEHRG